MEKVLTKCFVVSVLLLLAMGLSGGVHAAPPRPDVAQGVAAGKIVPPYYLTHLDDLHAKGICTEYNPYVKTSADRLMAALPEGTANLRVLALLVDFSDHPRQVPATFFDSLIFDSAGTTVRNYYREISYGRLDVVTVHLPSSVGWVTAPSTYAYYVDGKNGTGDYPRNSQKLVEDLVDLVDPSVDFSQYDNDGDGFVDCLMVIHSGVGAEFTGGSSDDIWSHKYAIAPRKKDNVFISSYTIQAEYWSSPGDMTIGVYAHEMGHIFGLPDLYDTDYSSKGIGRWCIMSYGSWNGPSERGESPAHPCAWSRVKMGFAQAVNLDSTIYHAPIAAVAQSGAIFRLWNSGALTHEYFLVENRRRLSYDAYLPGDGLLIWHIDDGKPDNKYEWWPEGGGTRHYRVALEQADGLFEMEKNQSGGDDADAYPGRTVNTAFDASSLPNSNTYGGAPSGVSVLNISPSSDTMYADLAIGHSSLATGPGELLPNNVTLNQNYPNPFNPATIIEFSVDHAAPVSLEIYNVLGQRVATLIDETVAPGTKRVVWEGRDDNGDNAASGVYFYRAYSDGAEAVKKMILLR